MLVKNSIWGLLFFGLLACDAKFNEKKESKEADSELATSEGAEKADQAVANAPKPAELQPNEVVVGQWASQCIPNAGNGVQPATVIVYQFLPDSGANFKVISYRDAACETRYTKADVDKLRERMQTEATTAGDPLTANELKELDYLWLPVTNAFSYKLGRKLSNGLIEMDMTSKNPDGSDKVVYGSVYFDRDLLYFAHVCSELDAQFLSCSPVAGDKADRRAKKVNFDIGYEKQALPPAPPAP